MQRTFLSQATTGIKHTPQDGTVELERLQLHFRRIHGHRTLLPEPTSDPQASRLWASVSNSNLEMARCLTDDDELLAWLPLITILATDLSSLAAEIYTPGWGNEWLDSPQPSADADGPFASPGVRITTEETRMASNNDAAALVDVNNRSDIYSLTIRSGKGIVHDPGQHIPCWIAKEMGINLLQNSKGMPQTKTSVRPATTKPRPVMPENHILCNNVWPYGPVIAMDVLHSAYNNAIDSIPVSTWISFLQNYGSDFLASMLLITAVEGPTYVIDALPFVLSTVCRQIGRSQGAALKCHLRKRAWDLFGILWEADNNTVPASHEETCQSINAAHILALLYAHNILTVNDIHRCLATLMTGNLRSDRLTAIYAVVSRVDASVCYTRRIPCVIHELRSRLCKGGYHWEQPAIVNVQETINAIDYWLTRSKQVAEPMELGSKDVSRLASSNVVHT